MKMFCLLKGRSSEDVEDAIKKGDKDTLSDLERAATQELSRVAIVDEAIHLDEGSGISRKNHFTARGLAKLLNQFAPHAKLLRRGRARSRYKTGTLSGVRTLAGYANTSKHGRVRFVISLKGGSGAMRFRLLRAIERGL